MDKEERIQYPTEERERRDCGSIVEEDESNARIDIEADQANNPSSVWDLCMIDYPIELHSSLLDTSNSSKSKECQSSIFFHQGSSLLNQSYKSPFISKTPSKANGNVSALRSSQVKKPPTSTTKQTKNPQSTSGITDGLL